MKLIYLILILVIVVAIQTEVKITLSEKSIAENISSRYIFAPAEIINHVIAGGFRGLAADLLWMQIDEYSHQGQWYKLLPIFKMVTFLQPKFILGWSVGGWHMAFNMYFHSRTQEEKEKWLNEGLKFLKQGIFNNIDRYDLYFEIGWTYYYKAHDYKNAIVYLKRAIKYQHPQFVEHLLAHSYEENGQLEQAYEVWRNIQNREDRNKALDGVVLRKVNELKRKLDIRT